MVRFGYYAFPFDVRRAFRVGLNGCSADPYEDQTGHGTTAYHAVRDWSYVGNRQFGVTLVQTTANWSNARIHKRKNLSRACNFSHLSATSSTTGSTHAYATGPRT